MPVTLRSYSCTAHPKDPTQLFGDGFYDVMCLVNSVCQTKLGNVVQVCMDLWLFADPAPPLMRNDSRYQITIARACSKGLQHIQIDLIFLQNRTSSNADDTHVPRHYSRGCVHCGDHNLLCYAKICSLVTNNFGFVNLHQQTLFIYIHTYWNAQNKHFFFDK